MDNSSIAAKRGCAAIGPNPTDRGRPGTKPHLVTDRQGIPLPFVLTGANVHDSVPFEQMLDAIPRRQPQAWPAAPQTEEAARRQDLLRSR